MILSVAVRPRAAFFRQKVWGANRCEKQYFQTLRLGSSLARAKGQRVLLAFGTTQIMRSRL